MTETITPIRLAIHGPPLSGKTTISRYLTTQGFVHVNFTQYLKILAVKMLAAAGRHVTVEDIEREKAFYRPWLQHTGTVLGFDKGFGVLDSLIAYEGYVEPAPLAELLRTQHFFTLKPFIAFDNVRSQAQYDTLKNDFGFTLLRLFVSPKEQLRRAQELGYERKAFLRSLEHPIETPLPWQDEEIHLSGELPVDVMWQAVQNVIAERIRIAQQASAV